jgi:hypothetical protein
LWCSTSSRLHHLGSRTSNSTNSAAEPCNSFSFRNEILNDLMVQ